MVPDFPADSEQARRLLENQIREMYGRVVYSHKVHIIYSGMLLKRSGVLKVTQLMLSALTTTGFIATIFGDARILGITGAVVSTILLSINAYTKDYDLGAAAEDHKRASNDLWMIRERYLTLLTNLKMHQMSIEEGCKSRDELLIELNVLYAGAPNTDSTAFRKAQKALKGGEMTFSDSEIDDFLPTGLRRSPGVSS